MEQMGKVWITGAGPGSSELLTIKAKRLLAEGDCIVYDRLVGKEVISMIPADKELIDVGKCAGNHTIPQEKINEILVREAKCGKKVIRLKGGDSFLFGRGGEEMEALLKEGIPFEVVPGISSSMAVPAYNGIPVTHRDFVSSVHIVTGHHKANKEEKIHYKELVNVGGTLVFLMGVGALPEIMGGLMDAGMRPDMPAAILQEGTVSGQRRVLATVRTLAQEAKEQNVKAPSVIVVGEVCALAPDFAWREKLPLFGEKIIVTRPEGRQGEISESLRSLGAEVLWIPAIRTVPVRDKDGLERIRKELGRLKEYQVLVFTSPYGVECFFQILMERGKDVRSVSHMKFAAIGQGTGDALMRLGLVADYVPEKYDGVSLGKLLSEQLSGEDDRKGSKIKVLLARSSMGGEEILKELEKNTLIDYTDLAIYDTFIVQESRKAFLDCIKTGDFTKVVFTSSSTVEGFCRMAGGHDLEKICAVCIGEKTGQAAKAKGMCAVIAKNASVDELIACILNTKRETAANHEEKQKMGDKGLEHTRNQNDIGEKELLAVSFGTSCNANRRLTIGAIEQALDEELGQEYSVKRAFTSQRIIDRLKKRDNIAIDNVKEALDRAVAYGVKTLVVQPTHLMSGFEYRGLEEKLSGYTGAFEHMALGKPLLSSGQDYMDVMKAVTDETAKYDDGKTAICFMGHGTEADSNEVYGKLQFLLAENGFKNYYVGTVEAAPALEDVIAKVKEGNYKRVVLHPLMIVAGDHANNDMAGEEEGSWKSQFKKAGYEVECILRGLGEIPAIRDILVKHAKEAADTVAAV